MPPQFRIHADGSINILSLSIVLRFCYMIWPPFTQLVFTEYLLGARYLLDTSPLTLYSKEKKEVPAS